MIIPLDKLIAVGGNKYLFTRAAMGAVDKIDYIEEIPGETKWKIVPNILKVLCEDNIQYKLIEKKPGEPLEASDSEEDAESPQESEKNQ